MFTYNQLRILTGLLAVSNIALSINGLKVIKSYRNQMKRHIKLLEMTTYLVHLVEEHDIPLSRFDLIAMTDLGLLEEVKDYD